MGILGWFLCSIIAVVWAMAVDRKLNAEGSAPLIIIFALGPIGLLMCLLITLQFAHRLFKRD